MKTENIDTNQYNSIEKQVSFIDRCRTPPMGWNSWDAWGTGITETDVRANAEFMAAHLARYGWRYVVVDIQWYQPNASGHDYDPEARLEMDQWGRLQPAPNRFPSGFQSLGEYIHSLGLKFGIHIMRGIPRQAVRENLPVKPADARSPAGTEVRAGDIADAENGCAWNPDMYGVDMTRPGAQRWYDSLMELYASWGVDFIKADDAASHLYQPEEIKAIHRAIEKCGRPMVLSLSPGPAPVSEAAFFRRWAHMWRISDDFWDSWPLLRRQFDFAREWAPFIGMDNSWPDADMLPLGKLRIAASGGAGEDSRFTKDEQLTMMNLWAIIRSPLMMGGDLPRSDAWSISLLCNPDLIAVNQRSRGNRVLSWTPDSCAWIAENPEGGWHLAVFNLSDRKSRIGFSLGEAAPGVRKFSAVDICSGRAFTLPSRYSVVLSPHASV
ncbi:MAG TPA: glycoside hydrolase family 27 protein, partial [Treponemataceae bacterium]|nr:glycoside hydrolase family 27 protein [Treponemataceae bacterium]